MKNYLLTETFINPLTDFGFHRIYGEEQNKDLLIDFLNGIIKEEGTIVDIEYLPTDRFGQKQDNRKAVFDICCKSDRGEYFVVEMQNAFVRTVIFV